MSDQTILATTLAVLIGLLIWGKWRYDAVTLICLASLVLFGVVPAESAFLGFGHPAVITVALVLLISRGLQEAGMVSLAGNVISRLTLSQNQYMIMIMIVAAFLSSFMNFSKWVILDPVKDNTSWILFFIMSLFLLLFYYEALA